MRRLAVMLVFFVLVAVTTLSLTVFFKTQTVKVTGNTRHDEALIIEKSGIELGENLITLNSGAVVERLEEEFVYIEEVRVKKNVFKGVAEIVVREAVPFCTISADGDFYLISKDGTVLERLSENPADMYTVTGVEINDSMIGKTLSEGESEQLEVLELMFSAIEKTQISRITSINVEDTLNLVMNYDFRIDVELGTQTELEYKMKYAKEILENQIKSYERGTLDVSYCHTTPNAVFSPSREEPPAPESSEEVTE